ncbi:Gustatory receptor, partial [Aphis craccivora]
MGDRYFMLEWMYTAIFYTFSCFIFYRLIYSESILKPYLDDLTLDNINYALMTSLSVLIVLLNPLLASKARGNREKYFKLWREYQIQYEQYTVSELNLGSSILIVLLIVGGTIVTTLELVTNCVLTSQVKPTYVYANWLIYFYTNLTTIQWVTDCHLLTIASKKLLNRFLAQTMAVDTSDRIGGSGVSVETHVSHFVELWRKLSDMSSGLINTSRGLYEFNFAVQSVIVVQALYGIAALYIGQHQSIVHYNVYFPTAAWSIINLVVLCEAAYSVTNQ